MAGDEVAGVDGGAGAHAGDEVSVGGHGEAGVGMAESFGDDLIGAPAATSKLAGCGAGRGSGGDQRVVEAVEVLDAQMTTMSPIRGLM